MAYAPPGSSVCVPYFSEVVPVFNASVLSVFNVSLSKYLLPNVTLSAMTAAPGMRFPLWLTHNVSSQQLMGAPLPGSQGLWFVNVSLMSTTSNTTATMVWTIEVRNRAPRLVSPLLGLFTGRTSLRFRLVCYAPGCDRWV